MLRIDGSMGEGGGQVLRSSLSLSALTGTPIRVDNIRAGRRKPGLLRQHLTALKAAAAVCGARVEGADLGSRDVTFRPERPRGGSYRFAVGTAGSATLVFQTVLPILLSAEEPTEVTFEGGTHNPMAPPFDFLERVYVPLLRQLGVRIDLTLGRPGFYPAGGGRFSVSLQPLAEASYLELVTRPALIRARAWVIVSRLPAHVAEREASTLRQQLEVAPEHVAIHKVRSPGPGNAVCVLVEDGERPLELFTAFGERGRRAERVAGDAAAQARRFVAANVPVGEHLADQLLLPLSFAGGAFLTHDLSSHTATNIDVMRLFRGSDAVEVLRDGDDHLVRVAAGLERRRPSRPSPLDSP